MPTPPVFHTDRLLLRPFQASDVEPALAYRNDPEFARFLPHIPQPFTLAHAQAFVALNMSEPWDRSRRVLEKLRLRQEAIRTADHMGRDGERVDEVVYGRSF